MVAERHRLGRLHVGEARHRVGGMLRPRGRRARASARPPARPARRSRRAPRGGNRSRPGRCGCARCAGACPPRRCARSAAPRCSCGCLRARRRTRTARPRSPRRSPPARRGSPPRPPPDDAGARQHGGMGQRAADILPPELAVEADRGVDLRHDHGRAGGEAAAPLRVGGGVPTFGVAVAGKDVILMTEMTRRALVAAGGTLAVAPAAPQTAGAGAAGDRRAACAARAAQAGPAFHRRGRDARSLADYAGQGVVLNLWATWCVPCVREMPALDDLAKLVAGDGIVVLPVSSDRGGAALVQRFYASTASQPARAAGPDGRDGAGAERARHPDDAADRPDGQEVGWLEGSADWSSTDAVTVVRRAKG